MRCWRPTPSAATGGFSNGRCRPSQQPEVVQDIQAWEAGRLAPGHMVILYENIRLPALAYPWSGDPHHLQATLGAFQWLDEHHMLPYGVASGEEFASGIGAFRKTETCDVTAMLLAASWMYRIQGNGDWGDRMERAFFNAGAAPVARDFQTMCYYQSPNRLRSDSLCRASSRIARGRKASVSTGWAVPRSSAASARSTASSPTTSFTCGWRPATTGWRRPSTDRARFRPWPEIGCR